MQSQFPIISGDPSKCEETLREIQRQHHVPGRQCNGCTECCRVIAVTELQKPPNTACTHCTGTSCAIYETRPLTCRGWACEWWLGRLGLTDSQRPDKLGLVFSFHPRFMIAHECRPGSALGKDAIRVLNRVKARMPLMFVPATGASAFRLDEGDARLQIERAGSPAVSADDSLDDLANRPATKIRRQR